MDGVERIRLERERQRERWGDGHDLQHLGEELALAATVYASPSAHHYRQHFSGFFPNGWLYKPRPNDRIRELEKAGALIAAEIDRQLANPNPEPSERFCPTRTCVWEGPDDDPPWHRRGIGSIKFRREVWCEGCDEALRSGRPHTEAPS